MNPGDLVRFRGNTAHGDRAYLVIETEAITRNGSRRLTYIRLVGQGLPGSNIPMVTQQFPAWRLEVIDENRTAS
jgi:hypothetical protein